MEDKKANAEYAQANTSANDAGESFVQAKHPPAPVPGAGRRAGEGVDADLLVPDGPPDHPAHALGALARRVARVQRHLADFFLAGTVDSMQRF